MERDPGPVVDQRFVRALAHPSRIAILETLVGEEGLGLSRLSEKLEAKPANVNYHVKVLAEAAMVESVLTPGGSAEQLYRLPPDSPIGRERWSEIPQSMRSDISTALMQSLIGEARTFPRNYDGGAA